MVELLSRVPEKSPRPIIRADMTTVATSGSMKYVVSVDRTALAGGGVSGYFLEASGDVVPPVVECRDFIVLSLIFLAMRQGADLHVAGKVSRELLGNLEEFQRAWSTWLPDRYRRIRITCDEEVAQRSVDARRRAVIAFSGGVDSMFAMFEQLNADDERDRCEIVSAVLIHGFDIGLEASDGFAAAERAVREITTSAGVPLSVVRTNLRTALSAEWPDEFAAAVVACLSVFSPVAAYGLLASDEDYRHVALPWGSNVVTNHLMSSDSFRIMTTGSAFGRTAKVAGIAKRGAVTSRIRVCWEGPLPGENCGICEKCVRTKLNFIVAGAAVPASLAPAPGFWEIVGLVAKNRVTVGYLVDIEEASRQVQLPRTMRLAIVLAVRKNQLLLPFRRWRRWLRQLARRVARRPALKVPV